MPVEITGVAPGPLLDALNRAEAVAMTGLLVAAMGLGFVVLLLGWLALQGMRR
jgi:hypothetical protein